MSQNKPDTITFKQLRGILESNIVSEGEGIVTPRRRAVGEPEPGSYAYERKYGKYTAKGELRKRPNPNKPPVKEETELEEAKGLASMSMDQLKQEHEKVKSKIESEGKSKMISMNHPLSQRARAIRLHMAIKNKQANEEVGEMAEAKGPAPGFMLKADPALAKKVKEKQDLHQVRAKAMGNPAAGKSVKEENELDEANGKKSAIYSTDVYGAKAYHSKCLEPGCDWESKRFDSMKLAQNAAQKHAQEHFKKGDAESSLKEANNPDRTTTHENPLVTVHNKHNGKWELHTHANLSVANRIFQTNVKHSDVHKGPVEVKSGGSYGNVKFAISKHHATEMEKDKTHNESVDGEHYCAKHVRSSLLGDGVVLEAQHADPDADGNIEWYLVEFKSGIHKVYTEDLEIMIAEYHGNHKKKRMTNG